MNNYFKDVYATLTPIWRSKGKGRKKVLKHKVTDKVVVIHLDGKKSTWAQQKEAYRNF